MHWLRSVSRSRALSYRPQLIVSRSLAVSSFNFRPLGAILTPFTALNGSASADFTVQAHAQGSFDIGKLPLYEASIPGLNIPG